MADNPPLAVAHTFNFTIAEPDTSGDPDPVDVASIAVTKPPKKTDYFVGDVFKRYGMEVTATLLEGGTKVINAYDITVEAEPFAEPGDQDVTVTYGDHKATTPVTVLQSLSLGGLDVANGQRLGDYIAVFNSLFDRLDKKHDTQIDSVIWYGQDKGIFHFAVPNDVTVTIGNEEQPVETDEETGERLCELSLGTSLTGTKTTVRLTDGEDNYKDYDFTCYSQNFSGMPNAVTDYFCIASQYTNGRGLGPYGINAVGTLRGYEMVDTTTTGADGPPTSLGNFGGYITYWYKDAITDDPKNPYGIDFIVYGNSYDGGSGYAEPGNVYVSEDGKTWYTLAGSFHYEDNALWPYSMTYTKTTGGKTTWEDSRGNTGAGDTYPLKAYYPLFGWTPELENSVTLSGVALVPSSMRNEEGNTLPPYPHFGYADVGLNAPYKEGDNKASNVALNPYTGIIYNASIHDEEYKDKINTGWYPENDRYDEFDLKWAVDGDGKPVKLPNGIHYVKIQTASNIGSGGGGIGEKSTEIHMMRTAEPAESNVGVTGTPTVTVNGTQVNLTDGEVVADVAVPQIFTVDVTAPDTANVYINGVRSTSRTFSKIPDHEMIRIIVQEGEKAPSISYIALTAGGAGGKSTTVTLDADGGLFINDDSVVEKDDITYTQYTPSDKWAFPEPTKEGAAFVGWYDASNKKYEAYEDTMSATLSLKAKWKYDEKTVRLNADGGWLSVGGKLLQSVELTYTVETPAGARAFPVPTKDGYTFLGWYEGEEKYAAFEDGMPGLLVLTAKWQVSAATVVSEDQNTAGTGENPPANTGQNGQNTGSGGGSETAHAVTITVTETATEGGVKTAIVPAVTASDIQEAVTKAAAAGGTAKPTIALTTPPGSKAARIPGGTLTVLAAADTPDTDVPIVLDDGEVTLNKAAAKKLAEAAAAEGEGDVRLVITPSVDEGADGEALTAAQKEAVESDGDVRAGYVYDVSFKAGDTAIEVGGLTGEEKILVGLDYTLGEHEAPAGVLVKYFDEDGSPEKMTEGRRYSGGRAWFKTGHLSVYAVTYDPSLVQGTQNDEETQQDYGQESGAPGGCGTGLTGAAALLAALALGAAPRRREDQR